MRLVSTICCLHAALMMSACKETPTSVLVRISADKNTPSVDRLTLTVFTDEGIAVRGQKLPESGELELPNSVVLFPARSIGLLRVLVDGLRADVVAAQGASWVELKGGHQVGMEVVLKAGLLPDGDTDGVPDVVDNCADRFNPEQEPCGVADGGLDAGGDGAGPESGVDGSLADLPTPDLDCDKDKDTYLSVICGGTDCDDSVAAVNPGQTEGPPGTSSCEDNLDNDCDGKQDMEDDGCIPCNTDWECDDDNTCTLDTCTDMICEHAPTNDGSPCTNKCVSGAKCNNGVCTGNPKNCPPPTSPCREPTCIPATGCDEKDLPDGTSCQDSDPCTAGETCSSGACVAPSQPEQCYIDGTCYDDGHMTDTCRTCDTAQSKVDWTLLASECFINGSCFTDGYHQSECQVCLPVQSQNDWSIETAYCFIDGTCYEDGATGMSCEVCDPSASNTSWTIDPSCSQEIMLAALNNGHTGNLGGLNGADALCQAEAGAAGMAGTFKAFLSTTTQNANSIISGAQVSYPVVNSKGEQLYSSWSSIFSVSQWTGGLFLYSFDGKIVDEGTGASPEWMDSDCWHGSDASGNAYPGGTCDDWTAVTGSGAGGELDLGYLMQPTDVLLQNCDRTHAVICVRIPL